MKHPEKARRQTESAKDFRSGIRSRARQQPKPYSHRRRSGATPQMAIALEAEFSFARRFWDEHAIKAGMAVFWTWFVVANWSNLQQVFS